MKTLNDQLNFSKIRKFTAQFLLAALVVTPGLSHASVSGSWYSNFDSAAAASRKSGKPLFVMIARTGCHACSEMEQNLSSRNSKNALSSAIKVRLESTNNPSMTSRFAAGGTPTTVIFASGNYSSPIYQYTGVMDNHTITQVGRSLRSLH